MRKIYIKVVCDVATGSIIEEEYVLYEGDIAECGGGGASYPDPTEEEKALYPQMAASIKSERERAMSPEMRAAELASAKYTTAEIEDYMSTRGQRQEISAQSLALYQQQISASSKTLEELSTMKSLASLTGELSAGEQGLIDTMSQNAITQLTKSVNKDFTEIAQKDIAKLAARGVLNSNIASQAIADLGERAQEAAATGVTDIESQRSANVLAIQEANKSRQLQQQGLEQQERLTRWQTAMGGGGGTATQSAAIQPVTAALQTGANLTSSSNTALNSAMQMSQSLSGMYASTRAGQFQSNVSKAQAQASANQTTGAAFGTVAMLAAVAA